MIKEKFKPINTDEIVFNKLKCSRCNHEWLPKKISVMCPKCKSYYWNVRKNFDKRKTEFKNIDETDTTRAEKLEIAIDETDKQINNFQLVIQKLNNVKDEVMFEGKHELKDLILKFEKDIDFLEDIKENDELILRGLK